MDKNKGIINQMLKPDPNATLISLRLSDFFRQRVTQYRIEMVFLYGSWASGQPHKDSDIDLAILFSPETDNSDKMFSLLTEITYKLTQELNKEVNIISLSREFKQPMLYYNAIVLSIPIFIRNYDEFLSFKLEAIHQMEDFQIYGVSWQKEIARKIIHTVREIL
jgi:predicted nucleotidyltransferase